MQSPLPAACGTARESYAAGRGLEDDLLQRINAISYLRVLNFIRRKLKVTTQGNLNFRKFEGGKYLGQRKKCSCTLYLYMRKLTTHLQNCGGHNSMGYESGAMNSIREC